MPFFQLSSAGSTCVFPIFGARPSPTGELPFLSPRAPQSPPNNWETEACSQLGKCSWIWKLKHGSLAACRKPPTGQGLVSCGSYSRLEKLREKDNELPHLMTRKKMYFGQIFTLRWLSLYIWFSLIQMIWTQYTPWYFVLWAWVTVLSPFLISSFLFLSPHKGEKKGSFWISGKFWYFHLGWDVASSF